MFHTCSICGFFQWIEDNSLSSSGYGSGSGNSSNSYNNQISQMPPPPSRNRPQIQPRVQPAASRAPIQNTTNTQNQRNISNNSNRSGSWPNYNNDVADNGDDGSDASGIPKCNCGIPASSLTVRKEGNNKGRLFFGCPKGMSAPDKCDFFEWDDAGIGQGQPSRSPYGGRGERGGQSFGGRGQPFRGGGQNRSFHSNGGEQPGFMNGIASRGGRRGRGNSGAPRRGRRCGICHQEGHTRRNCPNGGGEDEDMEYDSNA